MKVTLSDAVRRFIALFGEETEATAHDCLVSGDRVVFLVAAGDMATATDPDGWTVQSVRRQPDRTVKLVEDAGTPEAFIASTLTPTAVRHVTLSRQNDTIAYVEVAGANHGVAVGTSGKAIGTIRELARRHYDIDGIQLT